MNSEMGLRDVLDLTTDKTTPCLNGLIMFKRLQDW